MTDRACKAAADCTGEIMEAITNIPLLIVNNQITDDDAIDSFNAMKEHWAKEYRQWKAKNLNFNP